MNLAKENKTQHLNHAVEVMRFTLVYDGPLPSGQNDARLSEKQYIRREFHKQLRDLWLTKPPLSRQFEQWEKLDRQQQRLVLGTKGSFVQCYEIGQFRFVPLLNKLHRLLCEVDILFLRAEDPGKLFTTNFAGDLDNRLKVLFDALRMPEGTYQLPPKDIPGADENPFFCLLEHDSMISTVRLESERLYGTSKTRDHVRLVVRANVLITEVTDGMTFAIVASS